MDEFKIEEFKRLFPNEDVPTFRSLKKSEVSELQLELAKKWNIDFKGDLLALVNAIEGKQKLYSGAPFTHENINLIGVLDKLKIRYSQKIFVNWYRFDDVDEVDVREFSDHFDDFCYPDSDDIDVFDKTLNWIISIDHEGYIKILM